MEVLLVSVSVVITYSLLAFCLILYYKNRRRMQQTRTLDIEERFHENHARRIFAQLLVEAVRHQQAAASTQSNTGEQEEASSPVTTVAYKDIIKTPEKADSENCCAICIEEFEEDEICVVVERCGHCFHKNCLDQWFRIECRCPLCRCLVHVGISE